MDRAIQQMAIVSTVRKCCLIRRPGPWPVTKFGASTRNSAGSGVYRAQLVPQDFDWGNDRPLELPFEDLVIYEMHVRGFTRSPTSGVKHAGTFAGLREKIPYLKELGINCVELLPIFEFDETDMVRSNPETGERLCNYWGYNTVAFYAPKAAYAATGAIGLQSDELRATVKELHRHGIEVMLDVVFNHTAEGNETWPDDFVPWNRQPHVLHADAGRPLLQLQRLRQHAQLQSPGGPRVCVGVPAPLGHRLPHRRVSL